MNVGAFDDASAGLSLLLEENENEVLIDASEGDEIVSRQIDRRFFCKLVLSIIRWKKYILSRKLFQVSNITEL